jgi:DNA-binding transcriptional ArsR family regulator
LTRKDPKKELAEIEQVFAALSNRSRRHTLLVLHFRGGSMTAGEVAGRFSCTWPTTSRHLKVLEDAGLVRVEKRGRERVYHLEEKYLLRVVNGWTKWFRKAERMT